MKKKVVSYPLGPKEVPAMTLPRAPIFLTIAEILWATHP
jgi:hypothetical protein